MDQYEQIIHYLDENQLTLSTAESCTAGLIVAHLAAIPGCGSVLDCGYVVYSPQAKNRCLGVSFDTMERYNLTSEEVAREMAVGALTRSAAHIAVATTGVAGDGGDGDVPPNTICFAWAIGRGDDQPLVYSETRRFQGERNEVRHAAAEYAVLRIPHFHQFSRKS